VALNRKITVCSEYAAPGWRWIEDGLSDLNITFEIVGAPRPKRYKILNFERLRLSWLAVKRAKSTSSVALVAHGPTLAAWAAFLSPVIGFKGAIIAHSFNFSEMPVGLRRQIFGAAFRRINKFVVFSKMEQHLYSEYFSVPMSRFEFTRWGVRPAVTNEMEKSGGYVCAIGGNARDYASLLNAAASTPEIGYVLVVRPENLKGLKPPPNVRVFENLSSPKTMDILAQSRFMVLPLRDTGVACGHVTIVAAMHLGKASIVSSTPGVADYIENSVTAVAVLPHDVHELQTAIISLWNDDERREKISKSAKQFAREWCTEERIVEHFRQLLFRVLEQGPDHSTDK
jgi:glycosyltransferase involved in cell wall biosynthesis